MVMNTLFSWLRVLTYPLVKNFLNISGQGGYAICSISQSKNSCFNKILKELTADVLWSPYRFPQCLRHSLPF